MRKLIDPAIRSAKELSLTAKRIAEDGLENFRGQLGNIPFFSSVKIIESNALKGRDETHYFLVPYRLAQSGYALFTQRVLPDGVGPSNALPKARIFHLPDEGAITTIEMLAADQIKEQKLENIDSSAPLADRLDLLAEEIDSQSNKITGGLVIIGGVVAIANPVLGLGIAAKALLPTVTSKLSKHGINHVSDWLRDRKVKSLEETASNAAQKEIKKLAPEIMSDPVLRLLEESLSTSDVSYDPSIPFASMMNTPDEAAATILTASAISQVYADCLVNNTTHTEAKLHPADLTWLNSLAELG